MNYSRYLMLTLATCSKIEPAQEPLVDLDSDLNDLLKRHLDSLKEFALDFARVPLSATNTHEFERNLQQRLRQLGQDVAQSTYNHLEPNDVHSLPKHIHFQSGLYTRLNSKTPQDVWTLFGRIRLYRVGYRPTDKSGDPTLFPLAMALGLVQGVTPALADKAARLYSQAGSTQKRTLEHLRLEHDIGWGVKKLRALRKTISQEMAEVRQEVQVTHLLTLLKQAHASKGRHRPVLSVGRDGITLKQYHSWGQGYEVSSTATVSVYDRRGKRLGTVYLAYAPQLGQAILTEQLTRLLQKVISRWSDSLPRLCYVTDSGDNEVGYYEKVLQKMKHPQSGEPLCWIRVVDYYHASIRIWTLAKLLFEESREAVCWAKRMLKLLKKEGGVNRVLHSAAAHQQLLGLEEEELDEYNKAYRYLRDRMKWMTYAKYRRLGVPLGSGVTEAGCKIVYTQRLKQSGMHWKKAGVQPVLDLRVLQLSGVWDQAYQRVLQFRGVPKVWGQTDSENITNQKAA